MHRTIVVYRVQSQTSKHLDRLADLPSDESEHRSRWRYINSEQTARITHRTQQHRKAQPVWPVRFLAISSMSADVSV